MGLVRQCQTIHGRERTCIPPRLPPEWVTTLFFIVMGIVSLTVTCGLLVMSHWHREATRYARWIAFTGSTWPRSPHTHTHTHTHARVYYTHVNKLHGMFPSARWTSKKGTQKHARGEVTAQGDVAARAHDSVGRKSTGFDPPSVRKQPVSLEQDA